ncbi:MAG: chromate transporter [Bacteroidales bacterium]|nr:chromate transporter [Bacteroidales bacterium]
MITLLAQLFWTFFLIGMFTFGGGYAMLSLIQAEVVVKHAWMTESMFTDIVAISQMTPGPVGINCATYVGYDVVTATGAGHLMGIVGSLTATLAITLPSFFIVLLLVRFYTKVKGSPMFEGVMSVIRPAVVGLIGAAALILIFKVDWSGNVPSMHIVEENFPDWKSWLLFAAAFLASFKFKVNPILLIILSGVLGLLLY